MANFKQWTQRVFKGENDIDQPGMLDQDEVVESLNLIPVRDSRGLVLRQGFHRLYETGKDKVVAIHRKRMGSGNLYTLFAVEAGADLEVYLSKDEFASAPTKVKTFAGVLPIDGAWFSDWEGDRIFFTFGNGLYTWDFVETDTTPADGTPDSFIEVLDKTPNPDVSAPDMRYIINHRGRLFGASGHDATIYFCGTDDTSDPRWNSWSFGSYTGTNTIVDDGGSMAIAPYGERVVGLRSSKDGLLVFKDKSIVLWDWSDAGAPWEVEQGATTKVIAHGIGLINHEAVANDGEGFVFVARDVSGSVGVYRFGDSGVELLSVEVPNKFRALAAGTDMHCAMIDHLLFIVARKASEPNITIQCVYDTRLGGWHSISAPDINCISRGAPGEFVMLGSTFELDTAKILRYPSGVYTDDVDTPILFSLSLGSFDDGKPFDDKFFRMFWYEAGTSGENEITSSFRVSNEGGYFSFQRPAQSITTESEQLWGSDSVSPVPAQMTWDSGYIWDATGTERVVYEQLGIRGTSIQPTLSGESTDYLYINAVGIGYRDRKPRSI